MGDDITSQLNFGSISVSESRYNSYKSKGDNAQKKRREDYLHNLKAKRRDLTQYARALALDMPIPEASEELPLREEELTNCMMTDSPTADFTTLPGTTKEGEGEASTITYQRRPKKTGREKYLDQLMLPESLVDIPSDLSESWFAVPCPSGTRCLVISSRNSTTSRLKNGAVLNKFNSALPSGYAGSRGKTSDFCILDCIFHEPSSTYYVLDILCWKGYSMYNCTTDFRFYWKSAKLDETTAGIASPTNPYKFISLPYYNCDAESLLKVLSPDATGSFEKDTVIFYNKETDYTLGLSPLMCSLELKKDEGVAMAQRLLSGEVDAMHSGTAAEAFNNSTTNI